MAKTQGAVVQDGRSTILQQKSQEISFKSLVVTRRSELGGHHAVEKDDDEMGMGMGWSNSVDSRWFRESIAKRSTHQTKQSSTISVADASISSILLQPWYVGCWLWLWRI